MQDHLFALSIVIPVYNGAKSVPSLVRELSLLDVPGGLEIVLVNDGSADDSLAVCRRLCKEHNTAITVINLSRNFGEHNAIMAGLRMAQGAYIITMDDDLQNPPAEVVRLWRFAVEGRFDVVYAYYAKKEHARWRNTGSKFTNFMATFLIDKPRDLYLSSFRCISSFVAKQVIGHDGPFPYVDGLIAQITQNAGRLQVEHLTRAYGESNYTLSRLIRLFLAMCLNFSVIPLRVAVLLGIVTAVCGIADFALVIGEVLIIGRTPTGWGSLMATILIISGVQLVILGVVGEYVGRAFLTLNKKPQFVIRDVERNAAASMALTKNLDEPLP
ncbi:glycosyltransferase family 2 protein [Dongia sedimenti]|uniref:Glycosyltransferase family 2 protein n=1 Tax=Dongia sedimenti TaxID=3064282 RepID=A0ABU0YGT2_9PROT|nr:glycosyltransferase family 2 protein [Rhodospirillaceae bacterium R-7]